jgi:hypothetical protein
MDANQTQGGPKADPWESRRSSEAPHKHRRCLANVAGVLALAPLHFRRWVTRPELPCGTIRERLKYHRLCDRGALCPLCELRKGWVWGSRSPHERGRQCLSKCLWLFGRQAARSRWTGPLAVVGFRIPRGLRGWWSRALFIDQ